MKRKQIVLLMCSSGTDTKPIVSSLATCDVEILVPSSRQEALENLDAKVVDLAIVESKLDDSSGLAFLSETRRRSPGTLRVVLETEPIRIPMHALVNEIAPAAIFDGSVDPRGIVKLLEEKSGGRPDKKEDEEGPPPVSGGESKIGDSLPSMFRDEEDHFVTYISTIMNGMMKDENLSLPVLPEIAKQVRKLLVDEKNSFKRIAEWVEREQSMSARILQVANSPIYATREPMHNLSQAVARLGLRKTRNLLEAVISENLFTTELESLERMMRDLWLHSVCCAYCNEHIAQSLKIPKSEDYFTIGLFHDIGKLLILNLLETGRRNGTWGGKALSDSVIRRLILRRHNDLGARLVRKWGYPFVFQEVVRHHDDKDFKRHRSVPIFVTRFSNMVTNRIGYDFFSCEENALWDEKIAKALKITRAGQNELEASLVATLERIKRSCFTEFHHR